MSLSQFLPSKNFFLAILGIAVVGVVALVLVQFLSRQGIINNKAVVEEMPRQQLIISKDTSDNFQEFSQKDVDKDGLKDWEESLWETDPNNADTDGNGISDLAQVNAERSRMQSGNVNLESSDSQISEETLTNTDIFARDLFTTVSVLDQQGILNDNADLVKQQISDSVQSIQLYQPFDFAQIKLINNTSDNIVRYINEMLVILKRYPFNEEDLILVLNSSTHESPSESSISVYQKYQSFTRELEQISVPSDIRDAHIALVNAMRHYTGIIGAFVNTQTDPIMAMAATQQIEQTLDEIDIAYQNFYANFIQ
ncbi:hypothetical protein A2997_01975 [Candidatus Nomurabacteria bacterium RIFCSPLOWO2_01_FULL_36_10b]|uniref:Uncharacterized protein n=1 Tax=Candidatus Nomurabacteria bacterium RIFCSPLOWO2_01_FULL_36_10b TaxID=1801766 RepID=A0A1F6WPW8_9BACT|nr:MAG: hypothetical protein A2997_01975 [Candidatus Nomurabacteria bacterium RIFCSPLOWO2_01_FULL_36_10b]